MCSVVTRRSGAIEEKRKKNLVRLDAKPINHLLNLSVCDYKFSILKKVVGFSR
jgi:hypothetical protein